jgi:beta-lactam-binding protein with PASTA domain
LEFLNPKPVNHNIIMFKFITQRPLWLNILTGLLLAFVIFFIFIFSLKWLTHHDEAKTVPSVIGKSFPEAEEILEKAGFEVEVQDSIYVDTVKPMKVIRQVPEDGEVVKINRTVFLTINRAVPPMVEMPNLNDFSFRSAEMELVNMGLRVGDTTYKPDFARNTVLEQRYKGAIISPGTKIRMGSSISLVLGSGVGNEKFIVPSLIGLTYCYAKALIEGRGLVMGAPMASGITDTCGAYIYKQNPEKYNEEKKLQYMRTGQTIDVWLQKDKPVTDSLAVPLGDQ